MSKPTKPTPPKKRKPARVVIGGGTGSTQRPMPPAVARFARRIATAFSGTSPGCKPQHAQQRIRRLDQ